jgi:hypothetical protein
MSLNAPSDPAGATAGSASQEEKQPCRRFPQHILEHHGLGNLKGRPYSLEPDRLDPLCVGEIVGPKGYRLLGAADRAASCDILQKR